MKQKLRYIFISIVSFFCFSAFAANDQTLNELFHQANGPYAGNPDGKVTVVEFFDYQCSHCIEMGSVMAAILHANPNVRLVFKDFPIRGEMSMKAARAALAANLQGKYKSFYHGLLNADQPLTEHTILAVAKASGLDLNRLKEDMKSSAVNDQLQKNISLATRLHITGTPAFYIGKTNAQHLSQVKFVLGKMSETELQNAIDTAAASH